jgi:acid phosphatase
MRHLMAPRHWLSCLVCFALGSVWGAVDWKGLLAEPPPPRLPVAIPTLAMDARLGANHYMQTSAEYQACCLQIFQCAAMRLEALLRAARPRPGKPAVVMDLDETVLDNSAFQSFLYKDRLEYTDALWDYYEDRYPQDVALVPGARPFIDKAEALGVTVVFLSNRSEQYRKSTQAALGRLGIDVSKGADRLYLKPQGGSSDKSARREAAAARYNVLLFFGDSLRDFSEAFAAQKLPADAPPADYLRAIQRRAAQVDAAACHWGIDWFVLPNPVYGEWEKLLGKDTRALLRPTSMEPPPAK